MDVVSVIVPVYNVAPYLEKCLNSILNQTYQDMEIIIIDDGSTDESGVICDRFGEAYDNIMVIHQKNGGLSYARNQGIARAKGDYLVFVDSDDVISEDLVAYLYGLIKNRKDAIGVCDPVHVYGDEKIVYKPAEKEIVYSKEEAIVEMLYQHSFLTAAWGKIFPKSFFDRILFPVGMLFEDSAIMYKLFDRATEIVYGNAGLYGYMHRENSITTKKFSVRDCDILNICEEMEHYFADRDDKLKAAAMVYHGTAAFRIYMNAPRRGYEAYVLEAKTYLNQNGKCMLKNKNIRTKMRLALLLYRYARPVMPVVYRFVDRWK